VINVSIFFETNGWDIEGMRSSMGHSSKDGGVSRVYLDELYRKLGIIREDREACEAARDFPEGSAACVNQERVNQLRFQEATISELIDIYLENH